MSRRWHDLAAIFCSFLRYYYSENNSVDSGGVRFLKLSKPGCETICITNCETICSVRLLIWLASSFLYNWIKVHLQCFVYFSNCKSNITQGWEKGCVSADLSRPAACPCQMRLQLCCWPRFYLPNGPSSVFQFGSERASVPSVEKWTASPPQSR